MTEIAYILLMSLAGVVLGIVAAIIGEEIHSWIWEEARKKGIK